MPIRNYTTTVPANRSITEIQDALVKHGATGVLYQYEQGTGRIEALQFLLRIKNQDVAFSGILSELPVGLTASVGDRDGGHAAGVFTIGDGCSGSDVV